MQALPSSGTRTGSQPDNVITSSELMAPSSTDAWQTLDKHTLPASHVLILAHSLGDFFVMGQTVTEMFSVFDAQADAAEATRLTRHAQAMRVATLNNAQAITFELVRSKLLHVNRVLEVLLANVYAESAAGGAGA